MAVRELKDPSRPAVSDDELPDDAEISYPGFGTMFLVWTAIGLLSSVRNYFLFLSKTELGAVAILLSGTACYYPWIALTPAAFRIEKRFPLGGRRWARNLALLAMTGVPFSLLASPLMTGSFVAVLSALGAPMRKSFDHIFWYELPVAATIYAFSVAGGYFIRTLSQLRAKERMAARLALEKSQLEASLNQAKLEVLRARLNPHFLFNSLQNISVMARQDSQTASRMLTRLGDLLRAVLRQDTRPESTLHEEIELTKAYVALEQMRFGDRLNVAFEIGREVHQAMVPCFLLQPLIENAVIHGLRGTRKSGIIKVAAAIQGEDLVMAVTDNGIGSPTEDPAEMRLGVGLQSTCERLARMYPDRHRFSIAKPAEGGAEVRITIPLRFADNEDRTSQNEQTSVADR